MEDKKYQEMLKKLDDIYSKEESLKLQLEQIKEDKEFLQNMIMYKYNKEDRIKTGRLNDSYIQQDQKKNQKIKIKDLKTI